MGQLTDVAAFDEWTPVHALLAGLLGLVASRKAAYLAIGATEVIELALGEAVGPESLPNVLADLGVGIVAFELIRMLTR